MRNALKSAALVAGAVTVSVLAPPPLYAAPPTPERSAVKRPAATRTARVRKPPENPRATRGTVLSIQGNAPVRRAKVELIIRPAVVVGVVASTVTAGRSCQSTGARGSGWYEKNVPVRIVRSRCSASPLWCSRRREMA
jgi:hypothetical protein